MDAFIRKNILLIFSLLVFCIALYALEYSLLYNMKKKIMDVKRMSDVVSLRIADINKDVIKAKEAERSGINNETDVSSFMRKVNRIASECQVIINKMTPERSDETTFNIEMILDYNSFIRFASNLESLNVAVSKMEVHRYDAASIPPKHSITFAIQPRQNASPLTGGRFAELQKAVADEQGRRNPFQRFAYDPTSAKQEEKIDLTWIYILSGIGEGKDGRRNATINHQTYYMGETLSNDSKKIVGIESQSVFLEEQDGSRNYILKFRSKDKLNNDDR